MSLNLWQMSAVLVQGILVVYCYGK